MKKLYTISLCFLVLACKESSVISDSPQLFRIDAVKNYLPNSYSEERDVVYVNSDGDEKILNVTYKEDLIENQNSDFTYTIEQIEIILYDPNSDFQIKLIGSSNFDHEGSLVVSLNGFLMPFNIGGSTFGNIKFENQEPVITIFNNYHDNINLNQVSFENVFQFIGQEGDIPYESYSELDINKEYGVIGFRDENNQLWNFSRFKS